MGIPWLAQVRLLHMAILGLVAATCLIYLAYVTSPELTTTTSTMSTSTTTTTTTTSTSSARAPSSPPSVLLLNTKHQKNATSASSVTADSLVSHKNNSQIHDLTRGVPAQVIYQSGHSDINSHLCPELGEKVKLLVLITSAPSHSAARVAIRETWGHFGSRKDVSIAFMLGTVDNETINSNIKQEQYLYGDIIRGMFVDTYDNLTLKTISLLEWVDNYCPKAAFVLKTDDDMFINVSRLLAFMAKRSPEQRAIYGRLAKKWKPIRNKKSKYYISSNQYKPAVFPDFTTGPAYLLPARLASELYKAALEHTYFKLEDVFVTGIVANDLKIKRVHAPEFLNKRTSLTSCSVQKGISIHMVKDIEQYDLWKKLHDQVSKCKK